jgi:hypothetical protein
MIGRTVLAVAFALVARAALAEQQNDLREFRVGESVNELPSSGYTGFACADAPAQALAGWRDYMRCPSDARGLHAVGFRYDPAANPLAQLNDSYEGTRVAGQPVLLALLIGDDGRVDGIRIRTDPKARLYLRKKAFLFGLQARARYGADGWTCRESPPAPGEEPVGGVFINEHCEKATATRHLIVERQLYRQADQPLSDFIGASELLILPPY